MISEVGGNKKISTLSSLQVTTPFSLTHSKSNNTTFSHTLPFVAAEARVWSSFYLQL